MLKIIRIAVFCCIGFAVLVVTAKGQTLTEGFETGTKTSYASANVPLSSGVWNMNDALIGNLSSDRRTGVSSARVRNTGTVTMLFDKNGAGTVTIQHAVFGTDGTSSWELWFSINGGASYSKVGATVTSNTTTLQTASFTLNTLDAVRLEIRKVSGGANRINIDNVAIGDPGIPDVPVSIHLTLGNPSGATSDTNNPHNS